MYITLFTCIIILFLKAFPRDTSVDKIAEEAVYSLIQSKSLPVICRNCNSKSTVDKAAVISSAPSSSTSFLHTDVSESFIENLSPGMVCPIIVFDEKREIYIVEGMKWGLIPAYDSVKPDHYKLFNKSFDTFIIVIVLSRLVKGNGSHTAPRRCLFVVDGFYEWKSIVGEQVAGIWDRVFVVGEGNEILSFAILTYDSSPILAREIHDRQPVRSKCMLGWTIPFHHLQWTSYSEKYLEMHRIKISRQTDI